MVVLRTDLIKCVVLGDDSVGKTSLLLHYATSRFPGATVPSVFDNYAVKMPTVKTQLRQLELYASGPRLIKLRTTVIGITQVVCVFAISNESEGRVGYSKYTHHESDLTSISATYGTLDISGKVYNLQLLDTAEQGETDESRRHVYNGADVFILCFSVVNPSSFRNIINKWLPEIQTYMSDVPFIVVGTQADLRDDSAVIRKLVSNGQRPVSYREAASVTRRLGGACYFESSPIMKRKIRRIMNEAFTTVFCPKEVHFGSTCVIL